MSLLFEKAFLPRCKDLIRPETALADFVLASDISGNKKINVLMCQETFQISFHNNIGYFIETLKVPDIVLLYKTIL